MTEQMQTNQHINSQPRGTNGRVQSAYSDADLYEIVGRAARKAKAQAPETLSLNEFDRVLPSIGFPDAPSARAIYGRLKQPWPEIVETALKPKQAREMVEQMKTRSEEGHWLDGRHVFYAINAVCMFKQVETLDERDYNRYRDDYIATKARDASERLRLEQLLPTSGQILNLIGKLPVEGTNKSTPAWAKVLIYCRRTIYTQTVTSGMPIPQAIDLYIEATGDKFIPTQLEIQRLAREWDISVKSAGRGIPWDDHIAEARDARAARGLPTPTEKTDMKALPELQRPKGLIARQQMPKRGTWKDEAKVLEVVCQFVLDCQTQDKPPTRNRYLFWRKELPGMPTASTIEHYRAFSEWIHLAEDHLLEQKKAA